MINRSQVEATLIALGEEFLVDIPAVHDGKGDYKIDYFEAARFLVTPSAEWLDRIVGYINAGELQT